MYTSSPRSYLAASIAALILGVACSASAATVVNDFSATGLAAENTDPQWTVSNGVYVNSFTGSTTASTALEPIAGATPRGDFSVATDFVFTTKTGTYNFGLLAFGAATTTAQASGIIQADVNASARLRITVNSTTVYNTDTAGTTVNGSTGALTSGETYRMTLAGTYNAVADTLGVTFSIVGVSPNVSTYNRSSTVQTISTPALSTIDEANGTHFGIRSVGQSTDTTYTTNYDNFSVTAVPEPSTALSILGGAAMLGMLRRRRA